MVNRYNAVETDDRGLGDEQLRQATIGIRIFKVGPTDEKSLRELENNARAAGNFAKSLGTTLGENAPKVVLITNGDIAQEGLEVLQKAELEIIPVDPALAQRRARLGKLLIGEESASSGSFSYTDMLNALSDKRSTVGEHYVFISADLARRPEELGKQLIAMERVRVAFETASPGTICMIGSMAGGIHDPETITRIVEGTEEITLANASLVFPNNALSMVEGGTHFSGIADNSLTGKVEVDGKQVAVGGNEDFEFAFREMVYKGRVSVLVVHPSITRLAGEEWKGVAEKYIRRQTIYNLYAERILGQAKARGVISEGVTFEDIIDRHLFFAQLNDDGEPEIVLTARQTNRGVASPLQ